MVKYFYDKYEVQESGYLPEYFNSDFIENNSGQYAVNVVLASTLSEGYKWDYDLQRFVGTGTTQNIAVGQANVPGWYRVIDYNTGIQVVEIGSEIYTYNNVRYYKTRIVAERKVGRVRGNFLETIVAENGTYPNDGELNGFWYVRRSIVSTKSQIVITTKSPINLKDGDSLRIIGYIVNPYYSSNVVVKYKVNGGTTFTIGTFSVNSQQKNIDLTFTLSGGVLKNSQGQTVASNISRTEFNDFEIWGEGGDYSADVAEVLFSNGYQHLEADAPLLTAVSYLEELFSVLEGRPNVASSIGSIDDRASVIYVDKNANRYVYNNEESNAEKSISIMNADFEEIEKINIGSPINGASKDNYLKSTSSSFNVFDYDKNLLKTINVQGQYVGYIGLYSKEDDNIFVLSGTGDSNRFLNLLDSNGNTLTSSKVFGSSDRDYRYFTNYNGVRFIMADLALAYVLPGSTEINTMNLNPKDLFLNDFIHVKR